MAESWNLRNLLDWFLSLTVKEVDGFNNVYWGNSTTIVAAKIITKIIDENIKFNKPIINIASEKVNGLNCLKFLKKFIKIL